MKILAIIPARGGSKGVYRKNVRLLAGKALIVWTIEAALQARGIDRVIVSTEDEEIASIAMKHGADVPFMRPIGLALDETPSIAPVLHAVERLPGFDWVLLLQPTTPLRSAEDIEGIIKFCCQKGALSAVSIAEISESPFWMYHRLNNMCLQPLIPNRAEILRRQDLPSLYALNGALYLARTDWLVDNRNFVGPETLGYVMPTDRSVDIDTPMDWQWVEFLMQRTHAK